MKVLMISGDKHLLEEGTEAHARLALQKAQIEQLDVFVWPQVHSWYEISRAARENRYDIVTAQDPFWRGLLAWRVARQTGTKLNVQVHTDLRVQSLFRRRLAHFLLRRANSVRVVSEKLREQVHATGTKASVHVLSIYVDVNRFKNLVPTPHSQKTILWVGRFEHEKYPLSAVSVFQEVRAKGIDAKLIMLGTGSLERELRQLAGTLPIEFPGWQDPKPYLQVANVVLCTSKRESYGASVLEALAAGIPVVAPDVGIAKEAGAIMASRPELAHAVIAVLNSGQRGELKIPMLSADEWAKRWRETLV